MMHTTTVKKIVEQAEGELKAAQEALQSVDECSDEAAFLYYDVERLIYKVDMIRRVLQEA